MKKILASLFILSILFAGCEKDITTEDVSQITYFANFTVEGESLIYHDLGTPYTDAAVTAEEDGQELPVEVSVSGEITGYSGTTVNTDVMDKYVISYSAINSDGFPAAATRTVVVGKSGDLVNSIEGVYTSSVQRAPAFAASDQYNDMEYIFITKTGDNTYEISGAIGGYYYIGRDYGYAYAAQGAVITANSIPANDFSITQASIPGFGLDIDITNFTVDPDSKMITFTGAGDFGDGEFHVQLKQIQY
jgi:hypothetical protein